MTIPRAFVPVALVATLLTSAVCIAAPANTPRPRRLHCCIQRQLIPGQALQLKGLQYQQLLPIPLGRRHPQKFPLSTPQLRSRIGPQPKILSTRVHRRKIRSQFHRRPLRKRTPQPRLVFRRVHLRQSLPPQATHQRTDLTIKVGGKKRPPKFPIHPLHQQPCRRRRVHPPLRQPRGPR
jgi:hypothetical protein